MVLYKLVIKPG